MEVAREYQKVYEYDILLVRVNGKLQELHKRVQEGELSFVTAKDKPGMSAYQTQCIPYDAEGILQRGGSRTNAEGFCGFFHRKGIFR